MRKATFPRLRELREEKLGWEMSDLMVKLGGKPSIASLYRLERGEAMRITNAKRVFEVINAAMDGKLDQAAELKVEES